MEDGNNVVGGDGMGTGGGEGVGERKAGRGLPLALPRGGQRCGAAPAVSPPRAASALLRSAAGEPRCAEPSRDGPGKGLRAGVCIALLGAGGLRELRGGGTPLSPSIDARFQDGQKCCGRG